MRLSFRFRWIPFLAALLVILAGMALGNWQTRRAAEKLGIEQAMQMRSAEPPLQLTADQTDKVFPEFRRVVVEGQFLADWPLYLENRPYQGRVGFYLLMPLRMADSGTTVLVARGWLPRDSLERTRLPQIPVPAGMVRIEGMIRHSAGRVLQLGEPAVIEPGAILQNLEVADFAKASKLPLQNFVIQQTNATPDTLIRDWPLPSAGVDKHRGYAFQWYALAATALVFFLVTGFQRANKPANS
jgi:cytochrome oxidase assembly protein ShyY1